MNKVLLQTSFDWDRATTLPVACYSWGGDYRPETTAKLMLVEGQGLFVRLECGEADPRVTFYEPDTLVCKDSCLECFLNLAPESSNAYLNLESNAAGAMYSSFGPDRYNRKFLREMGVPLAGVSVHREAELWAVTYTLSMDLIEALYPGKVFRVGDVIKGNFYKCGDETAVEHYGSWQSIEAPQPDFHRPEYFGSLQVVAESRR